MQIELQLAAGNFLNSTKNFIKAIPICTGQTFDFDGKTIYIDKVTVTDNISMTQESHIYDVETSNGTQAIMGWRPLIKQELEIRLVDEAEVMENGPNQSPAFQTAAVDIQVSLTAMFNSSGTPILRVRFESIDFKLFSSLIDDVTKDMITDIVRDHFDQEDRTIDTSPVEDMLDGVTVEITNVGVATNSSCDILFMRLEVNGDGNQLTAWEGFFNNSVTSRLGGRQWALIFDKDLLEDSIRARIQAQMDDNDKFNLQTSISVNWSWMLGAKFDVSFSGEVIDACSCFFVDIDVDTDIFSTVTLSLPQNNIMRTHIITTYDADDGEVFCCALTAGLFWPIIGIIYMADDDNPTNFGHYVLGILFAFWVPMIGVAVGAGSESTSKYFDDIDDDCTKLNDEEVQCEQELDLAFGDFGGTFTATTMQAISQGPVLSGTVAAAPDIIWGTFSIVPNEFTWHVEGSCTGGGFGITQNGGVMYSNSGGAVALCSYEVINDPLHIFTNIVVEDLGAGFSFIKVTPNMSDQYLDDPYPCLMKFITNVGVRIVSLGNAIQLSDEEMQQLQLKAVMIEANCPLMVKVFPWQFLKEWLPDPPPDKEEIWEEIWQIVVTDVGIGESVKLVDEQEQVWAEGIAAKHGAVQLSAFRENMNVRSSMKIEGFATKEAAQMAERSMKENGVMRKIYLKQMQLLKIGSIPVNGNFRGLQIDRSETGYDLQITTDNQNTVYAMSKYNLNRIVLKDVQNEFNYSSQYQFMGREWKMQNFTKRTITTVEMYDVKKYGNSLLIRDADQIHIADSMNRQRVVSMPARAGAIKNAQFIRFYGLKNALYIAGPENTSAVYDYLSDSEMQKLTTYHHRPWFDRSARLDSIFIRLSDDGKSVNLYKIDTMKEI